MHQLACINPFLLYICEQIVAWHEKQALPSVSWLSLQACGCFYVVEICWTVNSLARDSAQIFLDSPKDVTRASSQCLSPLRWQSATVANKYLYLLFSQCFPYLYINAFFLLFVRLRRAHGHSTQRAEGVSSSSCRGYLYKTHDCCMLTFATFAGTNNAARMWQKLCWIASLSCVQVCM